MAFAPAPLPASLSLRSAKTPHSCRPGFKLVTQPESLSIPLTRPFAPATMLGLATLALRVWASSNGRPLHSGPFILRDKKSRPPRVRFVCPRRARLRAFDSPFQDYASKLADWRSPGDAPLANFKSRRSSPLFGLTADPHPPSPTRAVSPNAPLHSRLLKFPSERRRDARLSRFMPAPGPGMNRASRAAPRLWLIK